MISHIDNVGGKWSTLTKQERIEEGRREKKRRLLPNCSKILPKRAAAMERKIPVNLVEGIS